jgi:acetyl esterase/lipase
VLIAPGGGYQWVVVDKEGFETAPVLTKAGITVFVLRYRLPGDGWAQAADVPLQDAQRAMRLIRARAPSFGLDPARNGILGFSAGGHVAASLATRFGERVYAAVDAADGADAKPSFVGLLYPVITMALPGGHATSRLKLLGPDPSDAAIAAASCHLHVGRDVPPTFIALAADDTSVPPPTNGVAMYQALQAAGIPAELHVFEEGGHGFGLRLAEGKPAAAWLEMFLRWGARHGWFRAYP